MSVAELEQATQQARRRLDRRIGEASVVAQDGKRVVAQIARLKEQSETLEQTTIVLMSIGENRQAAAQRQIEQLVTMGLRTIFGLELSFHLVQSVERKVAVVDFIVRSTYGDRVIDTPVMDSRGGGLAATVGFMLRLVVLLLTPGARRVLWLDETFGHVSAEYETRLAEFIREVVDRTGTQVVLVTHSDAFSGAADKRYRLSLDATGSTTIREF